MPPESRGPSPESDPFRRSTPAASTLGAYLQNLPLPSPSSVISDQRTPTGPVPNGVHNGQSATPTRLHHFEAEDQDVEEDDANLDDDDFETHYSRQSSPASSSSEASESEAESATNYNPDSPNRLQRMTSLPNSTSPPHAYSHLHASHSTTSLPPLPPPPLYPPFYNRPPTPLPPSPSLTSLLRPPSLLTRSTQSTRPTTPDSSDLETPNDTEGLVSHIARRAQPLPPTHPKVPTYEYYGFVLYLASSLAFALYILWSYLPSPFLHGMGVRYYPNRWWSLAIPAWIVMALVWVYIALLSYNVEYLTLPMGSVEGMVDEAANIAILDPQGRVRKGGSKRFVAEMEEEQRRREWRGSWGRGKKGKGKERGNSGHHSHSGVAHVYAQTHRADGYSYSAARFPSGLTWRQIWNEGTDAVMDVPIGGVCEVLYGES